MSEKAFKLPEGRSETEVEFIRASQLFDDEVSGVILEGTFVEELPNQLNPERSDYKFEKDNGGVTIVNGAGNLPYKMKFIHPGDYCQISYLGKQEIKKGAQAGKMAHNYEVLVAE